jgi:alkyl sulfatase BDS1-like metallo-beta-lactamase superfamily hydrolase
MGGRTVDQETQSGNAKVAGDPQKVTELFGMLDSFNPMFNIVTP